MGTSESRMNRRGVDKYSEFWLFYVYLMSQRAPTTGSLGHSGMYIGGAISGDFDRLRCVIATGRTLLSIAECLRGVFGIFVHVMTMPGRELHYR